MTPVHAISRASVPHARASPTRLIQIGTACYLIACRVSTFNFPCEETKFLCNFGSISITIISTTDYVYFFFFAQFDRYPRNDKNSGINYLVSLLPRGATATNNPLGKITL